MCVCNVHKNCTAKNSCFNDWWCEKCCSIQQFSDATRVFFLLFLCLFVFSRTSSPPASLYTPLMYSRSPYWSSYSWFDRAQFINVQSLWIKLCESKKKRNHYDILSRIPLGIHSKYVKLITILFNNTLSESFMSTICFDELAGNNLILVWHVRIW